MKFPWNRYTELPLGRRNTLQIFITNKCNLKCDGCFARNIMKNPKSHISIKEYTDAIEKFLIKDGKQINILGGEPLLHPNIGELLSVNKSNNIKTTIYTNGHLINKYDPCMFSGIKLRVSIYPSKVGNKTIFDLPITNIPIDVNFMVTADTTVNELIDTAQYIENSYNSKVFFIFSMREMDNARQEFFDDTENTMPVIQYKELVHSFLNRYNGNLDIHISKRGVFESTTTLPDTKCRFANYFIDGKIIQCPYDVINCKYQDDYTFGQRNCQQNNTCLMSKVVYKRK